MPASWMRPEDLTCFLEGLVDGTTPHHQLGTVNPLKIEDAFQQSSAISASKVAKRLHIV